MPGGRLLYRLKKLDKGCITVLNKPRYMKSLLRKAVLLSGVAVFAFLSSTAFAAHRSKKIAYVVEPDANLRGGPSLKYRVVSKLSRGTPLFVFGYQKGKQHGWLYVKTKTGRIGWIARSLVKLKGEQAKTKTSLPKKVAYVSETNVNLRRGPNTERKPIAKLNKGAKLYVLSAQKGKYGLKWLYVQAPTGRRGFILAGLVKTNKPEQKKQSRQYVVPVGFVQEDIINLRKGPSTDYKKIAQVKKGIPLKVFKLKSGWYYVVATNGKGGWIRKDLVKLTKTVVMNAAKGSKKAYRISPQLAMNTPRKTKDGELSLLIPVPLDYGRDGKSELVETALQFQGVPYRWGGTTSRGFDCSGFVYAMFRKYGKTLPHSARELYTKGIPVSKDSLLPGDLVFFHTTRRGISHVGIYIGNGKFIHSSSSRRRRGVQVGILTEGYYAKRFVGARRIKLK